MDRQVISMKQIKLSFFYLYCLLAFFLLFLWFICTDTFTQEYTRDIGFMQAHFLKRHAKHEQPSSSVGCFLTCVLPAKAAYFHNANKVT